MRTVQLRQIFIFRADDFRACLSFLFPDLCGRFHVMQIMSAAAAAGGQDFQFDPVPVILTQLKEQAGRFKFKIVLMRHDRHNAQFCHRFSSISADSDGNILR